MNKKLNLYIDMDGVLANFNEQTEALNRFQHEKGFFANLRPFEKNVSTVAQAIADGMNVFILTASPNNRADGDKRVWLKKYLPTLKKGHTIIMRNGQRKVDFMKTADGILFDDYSRNREEWTDGKPHNTAIEIVADGDIAIALSDLLIRLGQTERLKKYCIL